MLLSILIPVYNERSVVEASLAKVLAAPLPEDLDRELVIVDDCSQDGTWDILQRWAAAEPRIRLFRHAVNQGKGAAVRTAIGYAQGDFCLIQDADLEYDPDEYPLLMRPLLDGRADAVFGSRYLVREHTRVLPYWHTMINRFLTVTCNMFCNLNLTDMETCYKVFRTDLLKSIPIRSNRFGFEPEITMKCAKRRLRIYEAPISYHGRTYEEGKKIGWRDGVKALGVILKFWLIDDLYQENYGRGVLNTLTGTPQYLAWLAQLLRPWLGDVVLEAGAGLGNMTGLLMGRRLRYVACESDPLYAHALRNRFLRTPNVQVRTELPTAPGAAFDTALCLNVLETHPDPAALIRQMAAQLKPGGRLIVLVPQGPRLFGSVDRGMGNLRRFRREEIAGMLRQAGLELEKIIGLNKVGAPNWWLYSRLLGRRRIGKPGLKLFDKTVWLWKRLDPLLPWPGLSLAVIARQPAH